MLSRTAQHWRFGPSWCDCLTASVHAAKYSPWIRWLSVVISEAAAKHCFTLGSTEHRSQIQNLSIFHATQNTGPTDKPSLSRQQKISSPLTSASPLVLQLHRCSTGFLPAWRTTFAIVRTPTRLVTTPLSLQGPNDNGVLAFEEWYVAIWVWPLPSSSLDPRLASGAFAVAKDENRERFIGDRRPLNRWEKHGTRT